jgi:IS30 family transposase
VESRLRIDWPPAAISGRLKLRYPDDPRMRISPETIYRWVALDSRQGGGLYRHLRQREIGRRLGRSHTTISREFQRAKARHPWTTYHYRWAHPLAIEKWQKPRHCKRQDNVRLVTYVETKIKQKWSPDEIANRLRLDLPDVDQIRIGHETIYRWIYLTVWSMARSTWSFAESTKSKETAKIWKRQAI